MAGAKSESMSVTDAIVAALEEGGIRFVLGMPGGNTLSLWAALHGHRSIRAVLLRQESLGTSAAEAFGRLRGEPVVVMGQGEWIVGNAGQGMLEALQGSSPVVVLTEMSDGGRFSHQFPYQSGTGDPGTWDIRGALAAVTKQVLVCHDPRQSVAYTQQALRFATAGNPGPVAVVFHSDALRGDLEFDQLPAVYSTGEYVGRSVTGVDDVACTRAASILHASQRPVVVAGNGVRVGGATHVLEQLVAEVDAVVVSTPGGKGVVSERSSTYGGVIGPFGWPEANGLLADADAVLAVGTRVSASDVVIGRSSLLDPGRQRIVHVDVDPLVAGWTVPVELAVIGDARSVLPRVTSAHASLGPPHRERSAEARVSTCPPRDPVSAIRATAPLHPARVVETLSANLAPETIVTCDAGENRLFMMRWFRSGGGGRYLQPASGGGMGYAVPAALGAKLAMPDSTVVAVCGDGGFGMSMHGLFTSIEEELPIAVVVLDNQALGWVLHGMGPNPVAASLHGFDYAAIAAAMGCRVASICSESDLVDAIRSFGSFDRPIVVHVPVSRELTFRDLLGDIRDARRESGY